MRRAGVRRQGADRRVAVIEVVGEHKNAAITDERSDDARVSSGDAQRVVRIELLECAVARAFDLAERSDKR